MKTKFYGLSTIIFLLSATQALAQVKKEVPAGKPKLVVGIVVDQMRNDYLYRYWNRYGNGGFKRLVSEGYHFKNAHYNYVPTYTGPGHCSIYTGATPRAHGIIGNDWYLKTSGKSTYCCEDTSVQTIGSSSKNGKMSPRNQLSSTIGDEMKMSSNQKAKVFAVSLKDRSSILPAGHSANGAFWFDDATGNFISSSWYMKELPQWLQTFNAKKLTKTYLEKGWKTLYPIATYTNSIEDYNRYEGSPVKDSAVFPYQYTKQILKNSWGVIKGMSAGNTLTKDLAIACLVNEKLGKGSETDLLCISFSSTDYVGHYFGVRAIETEDVYLQLDKDIEELLDALDKELGKNNYTIFLSADHGGADVPNQLIDNKIPAGYIREKQVAKELKNFLRTTYADTLLFAGMSNEQIFLNDQRIFDFKLNKADIEDRLCTFLTQLPGIAEAYSSSALKNASFEKNDFRALLQNGYNHKLSGNIALIYQPGWMDHGEKGTSHGTSYNYDTHIPIIFYGNGIKKGESLNYITITQIAPSICELLKINQTNSTIAEPLNGYFK